MNQTLTSEIRKQELLGTAQQCPGCGVNWLIFGVELLQRYICRKCGENFAIHINTDDARASETELEVTNSQKSPSR